MVKLNFHKSRHWFDAQEASLIIIVFCENHLSDVFLFL